MIAASLNTSSDLMVFLWPAPRLWTLRLPIKQRIGLIFVFCLGCVVCACGIARIYYFDVYFSSKDTFYTSAVLYVLSSLDCNLAILCGSLPELIPLFALLSKYFYRASEYYSYRSTPTPHHETLPAPGDVNQTYGNGHTVSNESNRRRFGMTSFDNRASTGPNSLRISLREGLQYTALEEGEDTKIEKVDTPLEGLTPENEKKNPSAIKPK